jgi:hypothetical protein
VGVKKQNPAAMNSADGLPYLTVALVSNQVVETVTADTAAEAQNFCDRIGFELDRMVDCQFNLVTVAS